MRINRYLAQATGMSRRAADQAIVAGRVRVNNLPPSSGQDITPQDQVTLDGATLRASTTTQIILLNKPVGYVVSRDGQGNRTVYDLLPANLHHLKPIGRLDKNSSGLLLLTNDGMLANRLTHPSFTKEKIYEVRLNKPLAGMHKQAIEKGIMLEDGLSKLQLQPLAADHTNWQITMHEGRNRQIRRTFQACGYTVIALHRQGFGEYQLPPDLPSGSWQQLLLKSY